MENRRLSRRRFLGVSVTGLAGAAVLAACGDGNEPDEATPTPSPEGTQPAETATLTTSTATVEPTTAEATATATATAPETATATAEPVGTRFDPLDLPDGPQARRDHAMAATRSGVVYVHGGRSGGASLSDLWAYDPEGAAWSDLSGDGPAARFGHNMAWDATAERLILFGGQSDTEFFDDTWAYSPASGWARLGEGQPAPAARYGAGHAYDIDGQFFYVSHGFTFQGRFDDTWALDLQDDTWRDISPAAGAPRPVKRCLHRTVWNEREQKLVLFGGQTDGTPYLGDTWEFDPKGSVWTEVPVTGPEPRTFYAAAYHRESQTVVATTGSASGALAGDAWVYRDRLWGKLEVAIDGRAGSDMVLAGDGSLLLWGGETAGGEVAEAFTLDVAPQAFGVY